MQTCTVTHRSLHGVVSTWGWYNSGGSAYQRWEAILAVLIWGWVSVISATAEAWAKPTQAT